MADEFAGAVVLDVGDGAGSTAGWSKPVQNASKKLRPSVTFVKSYDGAIMAIFSRVRTVPFANV